MSKKKICPECCEHKNVEFIDIRNVVRCKRCGYEWDKKLTFAERLRELPPLVPFPSWKADEIAAAIRRGDG